MAMKRSVEKRDLNEELRVVARGSSLLDGAPEEALRELGSLALCHEYPVNNVLFYQGEPSYRPDFRRWSFNPRKALALLREHCVEGPTHVSASNTSIWSCSGVRASFRYTWTGSDALRTTQEAMIKAQLRSIGIEIVDAPLPPNVVFGTTGVVG